MLNISIIGVPIALGQRLRGVDFGPASLREAGLYEIIDRLGHRVNDMGDIEITPMPNNVEESNLRNLPEILESCEKISEAVSSALHKGEWPLILGGDHSLSIGSLSGVVKYHKKVGVIWYDAHGDLNTDSTTPTGNIHGMSLAALLGLGDASLANVSGLSPKVSPENVVLIGARDLDPGEIQLIESLKLKWFRVEDIHKKGMKAVISEAIEIASRGTAGIHLSLDVDGLDPVITPGVGTPVQGGISLEDTLIAMRALALSQQLLSADFVEINPLLDSKNKTVKNTLLLIEALLGGK